MRTPACSRTLRRSRYPVTRRGAPFDSSGEVPVVIRISADTAQHVVACGEIGQQHNYVNHASGSSSARMYLVTFG